MWVEDKKEYLYFNEIPIKPSSSYPGEGGLFSPFAWFDETGDWFSEKSEHLIIIIIVVIVFLS